nr:MAG TPA: hypothetical protein [Crassvirales sp.]
MKRVIKTVKCAMRRWSASSSMTPTGIIPFKG